MSNFQLMTHQEDKPFASRPDLINADEVHGYASFWLSHVSQEAVNAGLADPGWCYVFGRHPVTDERKHAWFRPGQANEMADRVINFAASGCDVWMPASTIRYGTMGAKEDLVWVYAMVADYDGNRRARAPFADPESYAAQTSCRNGELHAHLYYLTSMSPEQGTATGPRFKAAAVGMDSKTGSITQKWRFPGTPNYKTPVQRTFVMRDRWSNRAYTFERLNQLLPPLLAGQHRSSHVVCNGPFPSEGRTVDEIVAVMPKLVDWYTGYRSHPGFVKKWNAEGTGPCRWFHLQIAAKLAFAAGITPNEFTRYLMVMNPKGYAAKFLDRGGPWELFKDMDRVYRSWLDEKRGKQTT